ncbi:oxidoreductase, partial [Clavibacter californiensis]
GGGTLAGMVGPRPAGAATWLSAESAARGVTITTALPHLLESDLFVCGPTAWAELVVRDARAAGLPEERIHVERFDR